MKERESEKKVTVTKFAPWPINFIIEMTSCFLSARVHSYVVVGCGGGGIGSNYAQIPYNR